MVVQSCYRGWERRNFPIMPSPQKNILLIVTLFLPSFTPAAGRRGSTRRRRAARTRSRARAHARARARASGSDRAPAVGRAIARARVPQARARAPSDERACGVPAQLAERAAAVAAAVAPPRTQLRACAVPSARRGPERERGSVSCVFPRARTRGVSALHAAYAAAAVVAAAGARTATRAPDSGLAGITLGVS